MVLVIAEHLTNSAVRTHTGQPLLSDTLLSDSQLGGKANLNIFVVFMTNLAISRYLISHVVNYI